MDSRITLIFRYDDYHASVDPEKDDIERRFLAAFAEAGVPLTIGVVPNYEEKGYLGDDQAKLAALRDAVAAGRVEPALHGLNHLPQTPDGVRNSEFAGQPQAQQAERLHTGKALIEDWLSARVVSFIPPWNTFDEATLAALGAEGFAAYSSALSEPQCAEPVVSVPHTAGLGDLRRTLRWLGRRGGRAFVVCMFHHFSFRDCSDPLARRVARVRLAELPSLLASCRQQAGVEFSTIGETAEQHGPELADGRLEEAAERWHLVFRWRRTPLLGRALQHWMAPRALVEPGAWARGNRLLRRLPRAEPDEPERGTE